MVIFDNSDHLDPEKIDNLGIRFIEIEIGQSKEGEPFHLELVNEHNSNVLFNLQILKLKKQGNRSEPKIISAQTINPNHAGISRSHRKIEFSIPEITLDKYNRLGIIITRIDYHDYSNEAGGFTILID